MEYNIYQTTLLLDMTAICLVLFLLYNNRVFRTDKKRDILSIQLKVVVFACIMETAIVVASIYLEKYERILDSIELVSVIIYIFLYISIFEFFYHTISFLPKLTKAQAVTTLVVILAGSLVFGWFYTGASEQFLYEELTPIEAADVIYVAEYILVDILAIMALAIAVIAKKTGKTIDFKLAVSAMGIVGFYYLIDQLMIQLIPLDKYRSNAFQFALTYTFIYTIISANQMIKKTSQEAAMQTELTMARDIQLDSLTKKQPAFDNFPEISLMASIDTAKEVGGDFYDYFELDKDNIAFLIADVSGKGVPASLFMMTAKNTIKTVARGMTNPAEIMTQSNEILSENNERMMFVTVWLGVFNIKEKKLTFTNAGHNPPMLVSADGQVRTIKDRNGTMVGTNAEWRYTFSSIDIEPGDRLFLYTDGLTEAHNPNKELYGEAAVAKALKESEGYDESMLLDEMKKRVLDFCGDEPQFDDITMMVVDFNLHENVNPENMMNFLDNL